MENSMEVPQKIKNRTTIQLSNSTSGYFSEENKNTNSKRYMHPRVHCSIISNSQDMEATYVSTDRLIDKEDVAYMYSGIFLDHKKNEILPFATTSIDLEGIKLNEVSQTEKDKYHMISLTCAI